MPAILVPGPAPPYPHRIVYDAFNNTLQNCHTHPRPAAREQFPFAARGRRTGAAPTSETPPTHNKTCLCFLLRRLFAFAFAFAFASYLKPATPRAFHDFRASKQPPLDPTPQCMDPPPFSRRAAAVASGGGAHRAALYDARSTAMIQGSTHWRARARVAFKTLFRACCARHALPPLPLRLSNLFQIETPPHTPFSRGARPRVASRLASLALQLVCARPPPRSGTALSMITHEPPFPSPPSLSLAAPCVGRASPHFGGGGFFLRHEDVVRVLPRARAPRGPHPWAFASLPLSRVQAGRRLQHAALLCLDTTTLPTPSTPRLCNTHTFFGSRGAVAAPRQARRFFVVAVLTGATVPQDTHFPPNAQSLFCSFVCAAALASLSPSLPPPCFAPLEGGCCFGGGGFLTHTGRIQSTTRNSSPHGGLGSSGETTPRLPPPLCQLFGVLLARHTAIHIYHTAHLARRATAGTPFAVCN